MRRTVRPKIEMFAWALGGVVLVIAVVAVGDVAIPEFRGEASDASSSSPNPTDPLSTVFQFSVSADGSRYISRGMENGIALRDAASGALLQTCRLNDKRALQLSPLTASQFSAAYLDGSAVVWQEAGGVFRPRRVHQYSRALHSTDLLQDGSLVAFGRSDGVVDVWDARRLTRLHTLRLSRNSVFCVKLSPDGRRLLAADGVGAVRVWELNGTDEFQTIPVHELRVMRAAFSPDGRRVVTGSVDGSAQVWNVERKQADLRTPSRGLPVVSVAFEPAGRFVALRSTTGDVSIWDVGSQREVDSRYLSGTSSHVEFCAADGGLWYVDNHAGCTLEKWRFAVEAPQSNAVPALADDLEQGPLFRETLR
jgi:WD40 repeat protein